MVHDNRYSSPLVRPVRALTRARVNTDVLAERWAAASPLQREKGLWLRRARKRGAVAQDRRVTARINEQIGNQPVRLLAEDGAQLGVISADEARAYAYARDLDLVEVAAKAEPPVCRALDYGKWRYEEERKLRASLRNQVHESLKEVQLRPKIGCARLRLEARPGARLPP